MHLLDRMASCVTRLPVMKRQRRKLSKVTSGFRLWEDQLVSIDLLTEQDPELGMSEAVRRGLDMFIASRSEPMSQHGRQTFQHNLR
jgi:hypothetical protein